MSVVRRSDATAHIPNPDYVAGSRLSAVHETVNIQTNCYINLKDNGIKNTPTPIHEVRKVLLLQGPVGPFFKNLQIQLETNNINTKRITFHAADALFSYRSKTVRFKRCAFEWKQWLRTELKLGKYDCVVLFGSERPAHLIAREVALGIGCPVIALEEGYLRSGFITCELSHNNESQSRFMHWQSSGTINDRSVRPHKSYKNSLGMIALWSAVYYFIREVTQHTGDTELHHRKTSGIIKETISWICHFIRRKIAKYTERNLIKSLFENYEQNYILVPLQVPTDIQMQRHARGWNNERLVSECLRALQNNAGNQSIVFKTHPLDQNSHKLEKMIKIEAKALGVNQAVFIVKSSNLSELTQHSSGMIVINSTSAFSALHHNKPVLVLGDAIYRHSDIVTLGKISDDIRQFVQRRSTKSFANVNKFLIYVKSHSLVAGDFYNLRSQKTTTSNVIMRMNELVKTL